MKALLRESAVGEKPIRVSLRKTVVSRRKKSRTYLPCLVEPSVREALILLKWVAFAANSGGTAEVVFRPFFIRDKASFFYFIFREEL